MAAKQKVARHQRRRQRKRSGSWRSSEKHKHHRKHGVEIISIEEEKKASGV